MSDRVSLLLEIGIDIDTAISIDNEALKLPDKTQRVLNMRIQGYTQQEIADCNGYSDRNVRYHLKKCETLASLFRFS